MMDTHSSVSSSTPMSMIAASTSPSIIASRTSLADRRGRPTVAPAAVIRSRHASVSIGRCSTMMSFLPLRTRSTGTSFRSYRPEQSGLLTVPSCRPFSNIADSNISRCSPGTNPEREQKLIWLRQQVLRSARRRTRSSSTRSAIVPQARPIDGEQPVRSTFRLSLLWLGSLACPRRVACWFATLSVRVHTARHAGNPRR